MIRGFKNHLFITGTDTEVGKTLVSLGLVFDSGAYYWKPVQTGSRLGTDRQFVSQFIEKEKMIKEVYVFKEPLSPNQAASLDGKKIEMSEIKKRVRSLSKIARKKRNQSSRNPSLVIEGAGGLFVPLNNKTLMIDFIELLRVPVLLVARSGLGTLNHTLLSIEALRKRKIRLKGLVLVGKPHLYNRGDLEFYGKTKVLWEVPFKRRLGERYLNREILKKEFLGIAEKVGF